jgi:hypothetical protein
MRFESFTNRAGDIEMTVLNRRLVENQSDPSSGEGPTFDYAAVRLGELIAEAAKREIHPAEALAVGLAMELDSQGGDGSNSSFEPPYETAIRLLELHGVLDAGLTRRDGSTTATIASRELLVLPGQFGRNQIVEHDRTLLLVSLIAEAGDKDLDAGRLRAIGLAVLLQRQPIGPTESEDLSGQDPGRPQPTDGPDGDR